MEGARHRQNLNFNMRRGGRHFCSITCLVLVVLLMVFLWSMVMIGIHVREFGSNVIAETSFRDDAVYSYFFNDQAGLVFTAMVITPVPLLALLEMYNHARSHYCGRLPDDPLLDHHRHQRYDRRGSSGTASSVGTARSFSRSEMIRRQSARDCCCGVAVCVCCCGSLRRARRAQKKCSSERLRKAYAVFREVSLLTGYLWAYKLYAYKIMDLVLQCVALNRFGRNGMEKWGLIVLLLTLLVNMTSAVLLSIPDYGRGGQLFREYLRTFVSEIVDIVCDAIYLLFPIFYLLVEWWLVGPIELIGWPLYYVSIAGDQFAGSDGWGIELLTFACPAYFIVARARDMRNLMVAKSRKMRLQRMSVVVDNKRNTSSNSSSSSSSSSNPNGAQRPTTTQQRANVPLTKKEKEARELIRACLGKRTPHVGLSQRVPWWATLTIAFVGAVVIITAFALVDAQHRLCAPSLPRDYGGDLAEPLRGSYCRRMAFPVFQPLEQPGVCPCYFQVINGSSGTAPNATHYGTKFTRILAVADTTWTSSELGELLDRTEKLQYLQVVRNPKLDAIPPSLGRLSKLRGLTIGDSPLACSSGGVGGGGKDGGGGGVAAAGAGAADAGATMSDCPGLAPLRSERLAAKMQELKFWNIFTTDRGGPGERESKELGLGLKSLQKLLTLRIEGNGLPRLPGGFNFSRIQKLYASSNEVNDLPSLMAQCKNCRKL